MKTSIACVLVALGAMSFAAGAGQAPAPSPAEVQVAAASTPADVARPAPRGGRPATPPVQCACAPAGRLA